MAPGKKITLKRGSNEMITTGKVASKGIAFGKIHILKSDALVSEEKSSDTKSQIKALKEAKEKAYTDLTRLFEKTKKEIGEDEAMIIDVQKMFLDDPDFNAEILRGIEEESYTAAFSVSHAGTLFSKTFAAMDDAYMKARATDILDLSNRLVNLLVGKSPEDVELPANSIILADEITPSQTMQMDKEKIAAFVSRKGSQTSHTSILSRSLGIPALINVDIDLDDELEGETAALDALEGEKAEGRFYIKPSEKMLKILVGKDKEYSAQNAEYEATRGKPSETKDGKKVRLNANIASPDDVDLILKNDAEGIGLFRSEFLYLGRLDFPSEEEQFKAYSEVIKKMDGREVVIRTMDIGADKKVEYFDLDDEENPALGLRAIRIAFDRPEIMHTQLRALYRASQFGPLCIMFPMIASMWEIKKCKELCAEVKKEIEKEGVKTGNVKIGMMIETPAAAIMADEFAKEVDFFSVGTNDLTQYTLAADRQNEKVEKYAYKYHPALFRLLEYATKAAHDNGIWIGICGELGSDPTLTERFMKIGIDELSVSSAKILQLRSVVRSLDLSEDKK